MKISIMNALDSVNDNPYSAPEASIGPIGFWTDDPSTPPLAFLGWRVIAFFVDYLLIRVLFEGLFTVPMILAGYGPPWPFGSMMSTKAFGPQITGLSVFLTWVIYFAGLESSRRQATLGKLIVGLRVVKLDNTRISFGRASARSLIKLLGLFGFFLGLIPALFTRRRQTFHDLVTRTVVVRGPNQGMSKN